MAERAKRGRWEKFDRVMAKGRDDMETRAQRGRPEDLRDILAQAPDVPPVPGDER